MNVQVTPAPELSVYIYNCGHSQRLRPLNNHKEEDTKKNVPVGGIQICVYVYTAASKME